MNTFKLEKQMHEIIVGNIGTVYRGHCTEQARNTFNHYVEQSEQFAGRAAGESVTWLEDNEEREHYAGNIEEYDALVIEAEERLGIFR